MRGLQVAYEMKLSHSRTASELRLQNQAVEMESTFNRRLEDRMTELANGSGDQLREAHQRAEELQQELNTIKLKLKGVEEVRHDLEHARSMWNELAPIPARACKRSIRLPFAYDP